MHVLISTCLLVAVYLFGAQHNVMCQDQSCAYRRDEQMNCSAGALQETPIPHLSAYVTPPHLSAYVTPPHLSAYVTPPHLSAYVTPPHLSAYVTPQCSMVAFGSSLRPAWKAFRASGWLKL
jgi:hypothetical protein